MLQGPLRTMAPLTARILGRPRARDWRRNARSASNHLRMNDRSGHNPWQSQSVRRGLCCAGLQKQSPIRPWSEATRQPGPELPATLHIVATPWDNSAMRIAVMGSGAVGGYYGARLALSRSRRHVHRSRRASRRDPRAGAAGPEPCARRLHRQGARRTGHGSGRPGRSRPLRGQGVRQRTAIPALLPLLGPGSAVLTLQNGVDSVSELAAAVGEDRVIGGTTYIATALAAPGVIEQTGTHRRDRVWRGVRRAALGFRTRQSDRARAGGSGHPGRGGRRRPGPDLGEVHLSGIAGGVHRRRAAADRADLAGCLVPGAIPRRLSRDRTGGARGRGAGRRLTSSSGSRATSTRSPGR